MMSAQRAALPKRKQVLFHAESFKLGDRPAFVMTPPNPLERETGKPWVFYGPALPAYPDTAESWMHREFLEAGIAVAGVDVGEAYGSPQAFPFFEKLYAEMKRRGYSERPVLLGRSRGGLWVSSWAVRHPDRVTAIAGIYPVYDLSTYPGIKRAAPAYGATEAELKEKLDQWNPIRKMDVLARVKIPVFIIHGEEDRVVPIAENSARLEKIYGEAGAAEFITLQRVAGQGHSFWPGFFHCRELVEFVITESKATR